MKKHFLGIRKKFKRINTKYSDLLIFFYELWSFVSIFIYSVLFIIYS